MTGGNLLVEMKNITKKFGIVTALNEISFKINRGEVHVLLGENGAGKSTLMKILSGVYQPTSGKITINGKDYDQLTPKLSFDNKISIIYQELSVINELSIQENLFVGKLPVKKLFGIEVVDYEYMKDLTKKILSKKGLNKSPEILVEELTISEKQQVEIAKALVSDANVIIMDEPTTSLTENETEHLFRIIRQLKLEGKGIVYISHKLKEIKEIGDVVTVLKDGTDVGTREIKNVNINDLVNMMVGREIKSRYDSENNEKSNEVIFEVEDITRVDGKIKNVSFNIKNGEILGFAGLVGSGRSELMEAIFGVKPIKSGKIRMYGKESVPKNEYDSIKRGMGFVTENRRETGFFQNFDIKQNISILPFIKNSKLRGIWGLVNDKEEKEYALKGKNQLNIKCASINQNITELSGGNQQKVILSKWMMADSSLMIFDEPTKGIDVGAKEDIFKIIDDFSSKGMSIIFISSDLEEVERVSDRVVIMKEGKIVKELQDDEITIDKINYYSLNG